ncbi:fimbrial protein [Lelliottia nimipressuralis]
MSMRLRPLLVLLPTGLAILMLTSSVRALENNLHISGRLVNEPCELDPNTSTLTADFKEVFQKDLYLNGRTPGVPFTIRLMNCDLSLGTQVQFTFAGTESLVLPGYLATTGAAQGIAIGIEDAAGVSQPVNKLTPAMTLGNDGFSLTLFGFVVGEPDALKDKTIVPGDFAATATFEASYP